VRASIPWREMLRTDTHDGLARLPGRATAKPQRPASACSRAVDKMPNGCRSTTTPRQNPSRDAVMADRSDDTDEDCLRRASHGEEAALAALFGRYRKRLRRMVHLRLDQRLQGRVDPSDVLQEAYLDVTAQLPHYAKKPGMPFFLWLRLVTGQRLMRVHRQ